MSRRSGAGLLLRQVRAEWGLLAGMAALVLVSAFLATAGPRAFNVITDRALHDLIDDAPAEATEVTARSTNDVRWTQLRTVDRQLTHAMPHPLLDVLGERAYGVTSTRYATFEEGTDETFRPRPYAWLTLRYQSDLLDQVRWVDGRAPLRSSPAAAGAPAELEIALAADVAADLDMQVGDRMRLEAVVEPIGGGGKPVVEVSGVFRPLHPASPLWAFERLVRSPGIEATSTGDVVAEYAAALLAEPELPVLQQLSPVLDFDWHYQIRPEALNGGNAPAVLAALEQTAAAGVPMLGPDRGGPLGLPASVTVTSGAAERLARHQAQATTAEAVSALVLAGLFVVALLVLALGAQVSVRRRQPALALARARGASSRQVAGLLAVESTLVTVPAAATGWAGAVVAVPARTAPLSAVLVGILVAGSIGFVSLRGWIAHHSAPGVRPRSGSVRSWAPRRVVAEAVLLLLAGGGLVLLRRRGLEASQGNDLFLASVPVLVTLAVGVLALRVYPALLRPLSRVVAGRSGPVSFVAIARGARQPVESLLPMAVLLLALGFAVFASAVQSTVASGQDDAAWRTVGADYRVSGGVLLPTELAELSGTEGVVSTAPAVSTSTAAHDSSDGRHTEVRFLAVDPTRYADVTSSAPGELVPRAALAALAASPGPVKGVLPAVVSPVIDAEAENGQAVISAGVGIGDVPISVQSVATSFPTDRGEAFVVVDLDAFLALDATSRPDEVFIEAAPSAAGAITRTVGAWNTSLAVDDRRAVREDTTGQALVEGTVGAFRLGVPAAAGYCLLATMLALVLTARPRAELVELLHTLGMRRRQVLAVTVLEQAPLVAVVALTGWGVGLLLPYLLVPAVDLSSFTGGLASPATSVDLLTAGLLTAGLVAVVVVAVGVTVTAERRRRPGTASRIGADT